MWKPSQDGVGEWSSRLNISESTNLQIWQFGPFKRGFFNREELKANCEWFWSKNKMNK